MDEGNARGSDCCPSFKASFFASPEQKQSSPVLPSGEESAVEAPSPNGSTSQAPGTAVSLDPEQPKVLSPNKGQSHSPQRNKPRKPLENLIPEEFCTIEYLVDPTLVPLNIIVQFDQLMERYFGLLSEKAEAWSRSEFICTAATAATADRTIPYEKVDEIVPADESDPAPTLRSEMLHQEEEEREGRRRIDDVVPAEDNNTGDEHDPTNEEIQGATNEEDDLPNAPPKSDSAERCDAPPGDAEPEEVIPTDETGDAADGTLKDATAIEAHPHRESEPHEDSAPVAQQAERTTEAQLKQGSDAPRVNQADEANFEKEKAKTEEKESVHEEGKTSKGNAVVEAQDESAWLVEFRQKVAHFESDWDRYWMHVAALCNSTHCQSTTA